MWPLETTKMKGKTETAPSMNSHLEMLLNDVSEAEKDLRLDREVVNYDNVKEKLTGKGRNRRMQIVTFQAHNDRIQALVPSGEFAQETVKRYKTTLNHIKEFLKNKT